MLVYAQHRKPVVLCFAGFVVSLIFMLVGLIIPGFSSIDPRLSDTALRYVSFAFMAVGGMLHMVVLPWFYHNLFGDTVGQTRRIAYIAAASAFAVGVIVVFIRPTWALPQLVLNSLLFGLIAYVIIMMGVRMRQIGDRRLRRAVRIFFILSAGFFPLMYLDSVSPFVRAPSWLLPLDGTALPLYFLVLTSLSIRLATGYFSEAPYMDGGRITDHFTGSFGLSRRELEIVQAAMNGDSNREIGEKLFISPKTVENHLYSIYQKTDVRNRVQLFNLIQGNKAG